MITVKKVSEKQFQGDFIEIKKKAMKILKMIMMMMTNALIIVMNIQVFRIKMKVRNKQFPLKNNLERL